MSIEHNYGVTITWQKGRQGLMSTTDSPATLEVATPPQFPKGIDGIWSPEHLFTAAVSSCLMTTFLAIADNSRLKFSSFTCDSSGKLEMVDGRYVMSEITLRPLVTILPGEDTARAERVLQKAEQNCLISNSVTSKIIFEPRIEVCTECPELELAASI